MVKVPHLLFFVLIVLVSCKSRNASSEEAKDTLEVQDNYQLNYNLAYGDERYQFIVQMEQMAPYRTFSFDMTNKRGTDGMVTMTPGALDTARVQVNTFGNRKDTFSDNQITVWVSRRVMKELMENDSSEFNPGAFMSGSSMFYKRGIKTYKYELNGVPQKIEICVASDKDNKYSFWLLNDPENPLIIRMDVGWVIWLKEINYN